MTKRRKISSILLGAILALGVGAGIGASKVETGIAATEQFIINLTNKSLADATTYQTAATKENYNGGDAIASLAFNQINPNSGQLKGNQTTIANLQGTAASNNFSIRNTTALPGDIRSITISGVTTTATFNGDKVYAQTKSSNITNQSVANSTAGTPGTGSTSWSFTGESGRFFAIGSVKETLSGTTKAATITVTFEKDTSNIVTSLLVNPTSKSLMTDEVLLETDYAVSVTKNGAAGSSDDYTAKIGTGTGASFSGADIIWGTTLPKLSDTTIQFKAQYPNSAGGSTFLTADVLLAVNAPAATSVDVTAAGGASSVKVGKKLQLSAEVRPFGANQTVVWSSSNTSFATVDSSSGLVIGVAAGDVIITATSTTPGIKGTIELNIPEPVIYDNSESFENHAISGPSYAGGSFVGDEGITINYTDARYQDIYGIDEKGILFRNADGTIFLDLPNGISAIKFDWRKAHAGAGNRQLGVFINGNKVAETPANDIPDEIQTFEHTFVQPYSGLTALKIGNLKNAQVVIDNLEWNNGPALSFGTLESLTVNTDSVKKTYYEGDSLSLTGLVAMAIDTEGREKNVINEITSDPAEGYVFISDDVGTKTITISYTEGIKVSDSFDVEVIGIVLPEHLVVEAGIKHTTASDSNAIPLDTDLKEILSGTKIGLLESAIVQLDGEDTASRVYYGGTNNIKTGIQPLKFGTGSAKGSMRFTFSEEINISKVTLYVARLSNSSTVAKMQVNDATSQNIGKASTIDEMHAPYEFSGSFGNVLTIRNDSNLATYLYGIDIQTSTDEAIVDEFVDTYMFIDEISAGDLGTGECKSEGLYADAKAAFNALSDTQRALFVTDAKYDAPRARLIAWAVANNEGLITSNNTFGIVVSPSQNTLFNGLNDSNTIMLIVIISLIGVSVLGGVFYLRKREQN